MPEEEKLKKGYEGFNVPDDFSIPSCGIEDVDRAVFELFDKRLAFEVKVNEQTTKVPVVFAAGERFALTKRMKPIRDKNNALILPIIAIKRTSIGHKTEAEVGGTAISFRQPTDYVIRKRLSENDRDYQNVVNKLSIKNQDNVSSRAHFIERDTSPGKGSLPGTIATRRNGPAIAFGSGKLNTPFDSANLGQNVFEVITIPYPQFIGLTYNVVFWTQYMQQMNQIIESLMMKFDGQGHEFQISTNKGYLFTAFVQGPIGNNDNFDDYTNDERIIKYSFDIKVPAYILAPRHPGLGTPFRTFQSAPEVAFGIYDSRTQIAEPPDDPHADAKLNKFILTDVKHVDSKGNPHIERGEDRVKALVTSGKRNEYQNIIYSDIRSGEQVIPARKVTFNEDEKI
jgi:hypothetical protein